MKTCDIIRKIWKTVKDKDLKRMSKYFNRKSNVKRYSTIDSGYNLHQYRPTTFYSME